MPRYGLRGDAVYIALEHMKLSAHGLQLELLPRGLVDDEDWVRVQVVTVVNGFHGEFEAWLQSTDLDRFRREINSLYVAVGQAGKATLASAEPEIEIVLTMRPNGAVDGTYKFESERRNGYATVLSGGFEIDQSFLPELERDIQVLLSELCD